MTDKELFETNTKYNELLQLFTKTFVPIFGNQDHIEIDRQLIEIKKQGSVVKNLKPLTAAHSRELNVLVDKKKIALGLIKKINEAMKH